MLGVGVNLVRRSSGAGPRGLVLGLAVAAAIAVFLAGKPAFASDMTRFLPLGAGTIAARPRTSSLIPRSEHYCRSCVTNVIAWSSTMSTGVGTWTPPCGMKVIRPGALVTSTPGNHTVPLARVGPVVLQTRPSLVS